MAGRAEAARKEVIVEGRTEGSRARQKVETRERILGTAYRLFCERGIMGTKTARVALAAGVSHGSIFVHFPTRDELVAAVIAKYAGAIARKIHSKIEETASVREVLVAHLEGIAEHEEFYSRLVAEGPVLSSYARSTMVGLQSVCSYHLAEAVEAESAGGKLKDLETSLLFNTWQGLINHYLINRDLFADPGESVIERRGGDLIDHFMKLITD